MSAGGSRPSRRQSTRRSTRASSRRSSAQQRSRRQDLFPLRPSRCVPLSSSGRSSLHVLTSKETFLVRPQSSSSTSQQNLLSLFTSCLVAMRPTVSLPTADLVAFLRSFLERSLACQNEIQLVAVLHLLANSVNKRAQGASLELVRAPRRRGADSSLERTPQTCPTSSSRTCPPSSTLTSRLPRRPTSHAAPPCAFGSGCVPTLSRLERCAPP